MAPPRDEAVAAVMSSSGSAPAKRRATARVVTCSALAAFGACSVKSSTPPRSKATPRANWARVHDSSVVFASEGF